MEKIELSVIIPTFNRRALLEKTLALYDCQTYPKEKFEIIVVDDGSEDGTEEIVMQSREKVSYRVEYIKQKKSGPASARNKGIKLAQGNFLLFTGDDIFPEKDLLKQHIKTLQQCPKAAVLGLVQWSMDSEVTDFMRYIAPNGFQFRYNTIKDTKDCGFRHFYTSNISLNRDWFLNDLFDEGFPFGALEDTELAYRLEKKGLTITLNTNAIGYHCHPTTVESFSQRMRLAGISAAIFLKKHPELERIFLPVNIEAARFLSRGLKLLFVFKNINHRLYWWSKIIINYIEGLDEGFRLD
jgi:glycosyltransferase involved in cell wall biosynthesis